MALVGIVVVSHSRALAEAAVALAGEMLHGQPIRIAVAAGLDDGSLGTDAVAIGAAITSVDGQAGVLVLMDLGSAVLSAELALELIDPEVADRVLLCPAPLVEGLVVAAVAAGGGASRAEVATEAIDALAGKRAQLAAVSPTPARATPHERGEGTGWDDGEGRRDGASQAAPVGSGAGAAEPVTGVFVVTNEHGLHARPAARLVQAIRGVEAVVHLRNLTRDQPPVPAASLSRVATLGALHGHRVEVSATGRAARAAVEIVVELASRAFDEAPSGSPCPDAAAAGRAPAQRVDGRTALAASPGIAIGPARLVRAAELVVPDRPGADATTERRHLAGAVAQVRAAIQADRDRTAQQVSGEDAAIFDAHLLLLDDPELLDQALRAIDNGSSAAAAYAGAAEPAEAALAALDDPYQRARAADVRAVADQVLRHLLGAGEAVLPRDGVLVAADLTPAQASALDPAALDGIVLAGASPTSHSAILARSRGIPAVVGAGRAVLDVVDGTTVAFDGSTGELHLDPPADVRERLAAQRQEERAAYGRALALASEPANTRDGVHVLVGVNGATPGEIAAGVANGADVVGLIRTEFVFLDRDRAPDVDEQVTAYRDLVEAASGARITLRTLDVGGDKPLPYLPQPAEANPFLGMRGLRLALAHPELLRDQLIAIVTVAHESPVSVMFPMVSTLDELLRARAVLDEAVAAVGSRSPAGLQIGVMVEVPALALKARTVAPYVDFFSIGTNDLTQYTLAAERGNESVAALADALDPGVLRLVRLVCRAAGDQKLVAVCGELAADPVATPLLVGLGVRELSVSPPDVPLTKVAVRATSNRLVQTVVRAAIDAESAAAVRHLVESS